MAGLEPYFAGGRFASSAFEHRPLEWSLLDALLADDELLVLLGALVTTADGATHVRDPGELHQELLMTGISRLDGAAVCIAATHVWVACAALLAEPPAARSKWLQRAARLPKGVVARFARALALAKMDGDVELALAPLTERGTRGTPAGSLVVTAAEGRRRSGSHYTPLELRRRAVERTLSPLLEEQAGAGIGELRVCDPAMGSGDFLVEAARYLERALERSPGTTLAHIVGSCLHGVDQDPVAVDLARFALYRLTGESPEVRAPLERHLRHGDALVGAVSREQAAEPDPAPRPAFDWPVEFPDVFADRPGFDACIGNPPWVAYAGRAAQPLAPELARYYERHNPAFFGYRTLHGLFVRRAAELVREGGRLGLVLPTSVSDLEGYRRTRAAHDALAEADGELTDFGNGAFDAVFQPCMLLTSTRRAGAPRPVSSESGDPWDLARSDLDPAGLRLLARLAELPRLDAELFGERGFQTTGDDLSHLRALPGPAAPFVLPIREGTDVAELERRPPRLYLDPEGLTGRLRPPGEFGRVEILIRQTARFPIAALSDGLAFRNSILAAFSNDAWSAPALALYLNSSAVRFYHYTRHRDARQGMPQLKIGHLRALPAIADPAARRALDDLGATLATRNAGLSAQERARVDQIVFDALRFTDAERAMVRAFAEEHRPPEPRKKKASGGG